MLKSSRDKPKGKPRGKPFQKGTSGNPRGRPRKEQTLQHWIDELGDQVPKAVLGGKPNTLPRAALTVLALYTQAIKGNVAAISIILDRKLGKPKQAVDVTYQEKPIEDMSDEDLLAVVRGRKNKA